MQADSCHEPSAARFSEKFSFAEIPEETARPLTS